MMTRYTLNGESVYLKGTDIDVKCPDVDIKER
jgi:hypothetical protein